MDLANNRKARYEYHITETFEAGIALEGTEVKSCRARQISLQEGFISIENDEIWLQNTHIAQYEQGNRNNHAPLRKRKLLLHRREITKLNKAVEQKGMTIIPLALYLKKGKIKVKVGLCKGKDNVDKRQTIKKREDNIRLDRMANKRI
jgi:SsrA-binding protein